MKNIAYFLLIVVVTSCSFEPHDVISGNGNVTSKILSTDTIQRLVISDKLDAVLVPSDSVFVILKADNNLHEFISTEIIDGTIHVSSKKNIRMARSKEIWIYSRYLKKADISSRSTFVTKDSIIASDFSISVSSGGDARVLGRFKHLDVYAGSGGNVQISGKTDHLSANINSAADMYAYDLTARIAEVVASSAADAKVNVSEEARFNASSAGDIVYRGEPKIIDSKSNSLGDIKKSRY